MAHRTYTEPQALQILAQKGAQIHGIAVDLSFPYLHEKLGNRAWGAIDYLYSKGFAIQLAKNKSYLPGALRKTVRKEV